VSLTQDDALRIMAVLVRSMVGLAPPGIIKDWILLQRRDFTL